MARGYKQRFNINPNATGGGGDNDTPVEAEKYVNAVDDAVGKFKKELITAEDAAGRVAAALKKYAEDIGLTLDQQRQAREYYDSIFGTEGLKKKNPIDLAPFMDKPIDMKEYMDVDLTPYMDKPRLVGRSESQRLQDAFDDAIDRFTKGLITADEAVRRQQVAVNRFGESLGMTVEERKQRLRDGFEDVRDEAAATGQEGPSDPDNIINKLLGSVGGRFGIPAELTKALAGSLGGGGGGLGGLLGGLGGGAGGGGGGMMGAAGSIAGPLALVTAGSKIMESFYRSVQDTTRQMTAVATSIAGNDGIGAVTGAIEGASRQVTSKIPILGDALQAQVEMYTGFLKAFDQVTEAFKRRGEELRRFDSNIAGASANAQVTKLLGDMNEAQQLGNEYAAIIREKAELQAEFQQALIPIKAAIMQTMIPILRTATDQLKLYNELSAQIGRDIKRITDASGVVAKHAPSLGAIDFIYKIIKEIRQMGEKQDMEKSQSMMKKLFDLDSIADMMEDREMKEKEERPLGVDLFRS